MSRRQADPVPRGVGWGIRVIALVAVASAFLLAFGGTGAAGASLSSLHVGKREIRDAHGRQVLLRGVNVTSLADEYQVNPDLPPVAPLQDRDYERMQALGFNVIRLAITWSTLEPQRGEISSEYIAQIRGVVDKAAAHGMYTILDMHNGGWGKYVVTPPDEQCPEGMTPSHGWLGAPKWATFTNGQTTCHDDKAEKRSPAVLAAWNNFWHNRRPSGWSDGAGIQDHLVKVWGALAEEFAHDRSVAGYDLMNEADPGTLGKTAVPEYAGKFDAHSIAAIRRAEARAGGFNHLVLFEPNLTWSQNGLSIRSPKPGFSNDRNLVFSPHLYGRDVHTTARSFDAVHRDLLTQARRVAHRARSYGSALWIGEWSFSIFDQAAMRKLRAHIEIQDSRQLGSAWWQWELACGAPQLFDGLDPTPPRGVRGNLNPVWCPSGAPAPRPKGWAAIVGRAYPRESPGTLTELRSHGARMSLAGESRCNRARRHQDPQACKLVVWIPQHRRDGEIVRPRIRGDHVSRIRASREPGGWVATASVTGSYSLATR